jgi:hypothetical protein
VLNAIANDDSLLVQCIPLALEDVFIRSDFVFKVAKKIGNNKQNEFIVIKQIKTWGKIDVVGRSIFINNTINNIIETNKQLGRINRKMTISKECYSPKTSIEGDTLIFFMKYEESNRNNKKPQYFNTTVVNGYEGIELENRIEELCKESEERGIYCGRKAH